MKLSACSLISHVHPSVCLQELRQYLSGLAEHCSGAPEAESPLVVILDNLHHVSSLGEIFNGVFSCDYQHWSAHATLKLTFCCCS